MNRREEAHILDVNVLAIPNRPASKAHTIVEISPSGKLTPLVPGRPVARHTVSFLPSRSCECGKNDVAPSDSILDRTPTQVSPFIPSTTTIAVSVVPSSADAKAQPSQPSVSPLLHPTALPICRPAKQSCPSTLFDWQGYYGPAEGTVLGVDEGANDRANLENSEDEADLGMLVAQEDVNRTRQKPSFWLSEIPSVLPKDEWFELTMLQTERTSERSSVPRMKLKCRCGVWLVCERLLFFEGPQTCKQKQLKPIIWFLLRWFTSDTKPVLEAFEERYTNGFFVVT